MATCATAFSQPLTPSELGFRHRNLPPTAQDMILLTKENQPISITLIGNDNAPGWTFSTNVVTTNGVLSAFSSASGAITYTPSNNYSGTDFFTFIVNEADGPLTALGRVGIGITPTNSNLPSTNCFSVLSNSAPMQVCAYVSVPSATYCYAPPGGVSACVTLFGPGITQCFYVTNVQSGTACIVATNICATNYTLNTASVTNAGSAPAIGSYVFRDLQGTLSITNALLTNSAGFRLRWDTASQRYGIIHPTGLVHYNSDVGPYPQFTPVTGWAVTASGTNPVPVNVTLTWITNIVCN